MITCPECGSVKTHAALNFDGRSLHACESCLYRWTVETTTWWVPDEVFEPVEDFGRSLGKVPGH